LTRDVEQLYRIPLTADYAKSVLHYRLWKVFTYCNLQRGAENVGHENTGH